MIHSNSMKVSKEVWQECAEWYRKRNLWFKEQKRPQNVNTSKLKHGIEKSNKLFEKQTPENAAPEKEKEPEQ